MNRISINLLLNFLLYSLAILTNKSFAQVQQRDRYIVVHPASVDPFFGIVSPSSAKPKILMRVKKLFFTAAELTKIESIRIEPKVKKAGGLIAPNNRIRLDDTTTPTDMLKNLLHKDSIITQKHRSEFITNIPICPTPVNNVDFVIIDTVAFKNVSELSNVNITYGPNFVNSTIPCNPRSVQLASIIVGKNFGVIQNGDRGIYNIGVFDCSGFGFPADVISGADAAIKFSNANLLRGRRTVVLFAGVRGSNRAVDAAAAALVNAGIPSFIAAGNSGIDACVYELPPVAPHLYTVGSTVAPGDVPAPFTNFGNPCVNLFLPGENLKVAAIVNGSSFENGTRLISGTVYSVAIAAAIAGMELELDPDATALKIFERIEESPRTSIVLPPPDSFFHQPMTIMRQGNACPYNRLFNTFFAQKKDRNKFSTWYDGASSNDTLCVSFKVKADNGGLLIGLRDNATDLILIKVTISDFRRKFSDYSSTIVEGDMLLARDVRTNKIIEAKNYKVVTIRYIDGVVSASYDSLSNNDPTPLLFAQVSKKPTEISFSSTNGGVTYGNALRCIT